MTLFGRSSLGDSTSWMSDNYSVWLSSSECGTGGGSLLSTICLLFAGEVKDYMSRAEQLKQLLKPDHADACDGAHLPHELGIYFSTKNCLHILEI